MTYKIDEHTEFWGGARHMPQTVKENVAEYHASKDAFDTAANLPTAAEIKAMADELVSRGGKKLSEITKAAQNVYTTDLRKQLDAWPTSQNITKEAIKHDDGKPDWSLVPFESLEGMVKVLEFGAQKYAGWNWTTNGGFPYMRVMRSCLRHLFAWSRGEDIDPESGLSHIHHAMCNLLFISHYIGNKEKYNKDDRQVR